MKAKRLSAFLSFAILAILLIVCLPFSDVSAASPSISLSPKKGVAGNSVDITGKYFTEDYHYYIFFDTKYLAKGTIDNEGKFSETITIPDNYDNNTYKISVFANEDHSSHPEIDDFNKEIDEYAQADFELRATNNNTRIEMIPDKGLAGDVIEIKGSGFTKDFYYYIFFEQDYLKKGIVDSNGEFSKAITILEYADTGKIYRIKVYASEKEYPKPDYEDNYDEEALVNIEINKADAKITSDFVSGNVGDTFTLSGSGFAKNKTLTVSWDDTTKFQTTISSDSSGTFSGKSYTVPESFYGPHNIKVTDGSGSDASIIYSITPKITLSANIVLSGKVISISGNGFKETSDITFYIDNTVIKATAKTTSSGTLSSTSLTIPEATIAGSHVIKAQDALTNSASANVSITTPTTTLTTTTITKSTPTSTSTQTQTSTTTPITTATTTSQPPPGTGFPVWAIVIILIAAILIIIIVITVARRRK